MKKIALILAVMMMLCALGGALASGVVLATGSVNLRKGPGLGYDKVASIRKGDTLEYLGETSTDARGVDWYKVDYRGKARWISSRYSELEGADEDDYEDDYEDEPEVTPTATPKAPAQTPIPLDITGVPTFGNADMLELSGYYLQDLTETAETLGLTESGQDPSASELQRFYLNDALLIAGNDAVEHMLLNGPGYSIFGAFVGMDIESARSTLAIAGLVQAGNTVGAYFEHLAGENSPINVDGFDSGISLMTDDQGTVTEISWSTYSGY